MLGYGEGWLILIVILYIAVGIFLLMMIFRFVKSHESIAESLKKVSDKWKEEIK